MDYITLPKTELKVSKVCLGTMTFGEQNTEADAHSQLDLAREHGINFIDTAEMYPVPAKAETQGRTETYIGSWLVRQKRDEIVLATKAAGPSRGMAWMRGGPQFTPAQITQACEDSLRRLRTDYIDLYQLHWPARNVPMFGETFFDPAREIPGTPPVEEQVKTLEALRQAGKIRAWGLSNETPWGVMAFQHTAARLGVPGPVTVQNAFNLINRTWENGLAEIGFRENIGLLAYSPLAFGLLSGKYTAEPKGIGRMTLFPRFGARYLKPMVDEAVRAYTALARQFNLSPTKLALAWTVSRWYVTSTILGATSTAQLTEDLEACAAKLQPEVLNAVEDLHRRYPSPAQ